LWQRQRRALSILEWIAAPEALDQLARTLRSHPSPGIQAWAIEREEAESRTSRITPNGAVELILIEGGRFLMGSPTTDSQARESEQPQHEVRLSPFYLGKYPVTNDEYARFLAANPDVKEPRFWSDRRFNGPRQPVVGVSWEEARHFAEWVGGRLPSEAEWEYAARAGTTTRYCWGDEFEAKRVNCDDSGSEWSGEQTSPVDAFPPNPSGLHDTAGNVLEWVEDCWHENYEGAPEDATPWLESGGGNCGRRVLRGGSWNSRTRNVRSASRYRFAPDLRNNSVGFRLAQDIN
jgi:formylglycine-generating enzyme required for sulfatase activity